MSRPGQRTALRDADNPPTSHSSQRIVGASVYRAEVARQGPTARLAAGENAQLALDRGELAVERVNHGQRHVDELSFGTTTWDRHRLQYPRACRARTRTCGLPRRPLRPLKSCLYERDHRKANSMKDLTHRDEIHGDVYYDPLAVALLNTPTLQRLGRVYQLGYGHLVYRGGTHTRLSHCMGAYATAARLVNALRTNYEGKSKPLGAIDPHEFLPRAPAAAGAAAAAPAESRSAPEPMRFDIEDGRPAGAEPAAISPEVDDLADRWLVLLHLVSWAGLLHDVGHVPLGHTLEDEFDNIYRKHDDFSSPRLRHLWLAEDSDIRRVLAHKELYPEAFRRLKITDPEDVWAALFLICTWKERITDGSRTSFEDLLAEHIEAKADENDPVATALRDHMERLRGTLFSPYMADIVANTISADYLDYLRRDPRNLGLDVLKDDRVVSRFWVGRDHLRQARMALSLVDRRGKPRLDTCTGVVELVRQRYRFAEIVYYHKTKVAASAMLAKVFHLVDRPAEIPQPRALPRLHDVPALVDRLLEAPARQRTERLNSLRGDCVPSTLLDTEIGDESLDPLLRERALRQVEAAVKSSDRNGAVAGLQAVSLLDSIARRELFKVCFSMDAKQFPALSGRPHLPPGEAERMLADLIKDLRADESARTELEAAMVDAALGWPAAAILLYVPPRKSQAKGIETGALADGVVVTLGSHHAVEDAVEDLNNHYRNLWRLLVLVHPDHQDDAIGMSSAVDAFVTTRFPEVPLDDPAIRAALNDCCWFAYLPQKDRKAAAIFRELARNGGEGEVKWELLEEFDRLLDGRSGDEELAFGATLLDVLARTPGGDGCVRVREHFRNPGSLQRRVEELRGEVVVTMSREGAGDLPEELLSARAAIERIAEEFDA